VCAQGLTAEGWARKRGHVALADLIARGGEDEEESEARGIHVVYTHARTGLTWL
jgi:hypothetical protein